MTLVAATIALPIPQTGDPEWTLAVVSSISGLQEVEPGWVLANAAVLPAGAKYDPLRTFLGTTYGSNGQLPNLIDGVVPIGKGSTLYTALNATDGASTVTLTFAQIWNHTHTWDNESVANPASDGWADYHSTPPFDDGGYDAASNTFAAGGGGAHNNMSPYVVVEGMMIKL